MNTRKAGTALGLTGIGAALGAGGLALAQYVQEQSLPAYGRAMTQEEHAIQNLSGFRERYTKVTPEEMAMYEGIRQGLMAGEISGEEVYSMAASKKLPERVVSLLVDVLDFGQYGALPDRSGGQSAPELLGYSGSPSVS